MMPWPLTSLPFGMGIGIAMGRLATMMFGFGLSWMSPITPLFFALFAGALFVLLVRTFIGVPVLVAFLPR